jgi:hypothetical protein
VAPLILAIAGTRAGAMFGHPAFFSGRKMFACVYGGGIALRLPAETASRVGRRKDVIEFRPHGRAMRNWVEIRRARAEDYKLDAALFREAAAFAQMLDGLVLA